MFTRPTLLVLTASENETTLVSTLFPQQVYIPTKAPTIEQTVPENY
jgi:hypothetical protein